MEIEKSHIKTFDNSEFGGSRYAVRLLYASSLKIHPTKRIGFAESQTMHKDKCNIEAKHKESNIKIEHSKSWLKSFPGSLIIEY